MLFLVRDCKGKEFTEKLIAAEKNRQHKVEIFRQQNLQTKNMNYYLKDW